MNDTVQFMNNFNKNTEDHFKILRKIQKDPKHSQRKMASELGFSLGKLNYCLKGLQQKGYIKIKNTGLLQESGKSSFEFGNTDNRNVV